MLAPCKKNYNTLDSVLKNRDITLLTKVFIIKAVVFLIVIYYIMWIYTYICRWELDHKKDWGPKNWCFWTVVLEKTLESPLDSKDIKPVNPKQNQLWIFIGKTGAEAETPVLWPPDAKNWLIGKDPDTGKDWRQEEKGTSGGEMVGWHHWLDGHEFEQTQGDSEGQGSLMCYSLWGCRVRHDLVT